MLKGLQGIQVQFIDHDHPLYAEEMALRFQILRLPLGLPLGSQTFPFERECLHLVAIKDGRVIACLLFHPEGRHAGRLLQMAVATHEQGRGIGTALIRTMEQHLASEGYREVYLHSREPVVPFYERLGYGAEGETFVEVGIPHRMMRRRLA